MTLSLEKKIELIQTSRFYTCRTWRKKRKEILLRDNNECQHCKSKGLFSPAECVHHIKELDLHPELALTDENLISLCNRCHNIVHDKHLNIVRSVPKFHVEERW